MSKKLYLHIGPHKTGTTYIQQFLHENRRKLAAQGLVYPKEFFLYHGHHKLFDELKKDIRTREYQRAIRKIDSYTENIVISSERLCKLPVEKLAILISDLASYEVFLLYSYRLPTLRFYSEWQENIKHGSSLTFMEEFGSAVMNPFKSERLNTLLTLDGYSRHFGKSNLKILDYQSGLRSGSTLNNFLEAVNTPMNFNFSRESVNASLPVDLIEIIRTLNSIHVARGNRPSSAVREKFLCKQKDFKDEIMFLKDAVRDSKHQLVPLGATFFDFHVHKQMIERYSECCCVNFTKPSSEVKRVPLANWLWSRSNGLEPIQIVQRVYEQLEL